MAQETLHLGAHETLRVLGETPQALEIEATWTPGGSAPIAHLHPSQDEQFVVLAGQLTALVDGVTHELSQGDTLSVPRGTTHKMWNAGEAPAKASWIVTPAGRTLEWFRTVDRIGRQGTRQPPMDEMIPAVTAFADVFVVVMDG